MVMTSLVIGLQHKVSGIQITFSRPSAVRDEFVGSIIMCDMSYLFHLLIVGKKCQGSNRRSFIPSFYLY